MPDVRFACAAQSVEPIAHRSSIESPSPCPTRHRVLGPNGGTYLPRARTTARGGLPSSFRVLGSQPSGTLALLARRTAALSRFPVHPAPRPSEVPGRPRYPRRSVRPQPPACIHESGARSTLRRRAHFLVGSALSGSTQHEEPGSRLGDRHSPGLCQHPSTNQRQT